MNFGTQFGAEISRQVIINKLGSPARQKAHLLGVLKMGIVAQ
jgi:hypothetical protein